MVAVVVPLQLAGADELGLGVDDPRHDLLVLAVDALGLLLLAHVVQRLRGSPVHFEILLVNPTTSALRYV